MAADLIPEIAEDVLRRRCVKVWCSGRIYPKCSAASLRKIIIETRIRFYVSRIRFWLPHKRLLIDAMEYAVARFERRIRNNVDGGKVLVEQSRTVVANLTNKQR